MKNHTSIEPLETRIAPAVLFAVEAGTNKLVSFDSATPGTLLTDVTISGLQVTEVIADIDFRPSTGELFAISLVDDGAVRTGRLYKLNTDTAAATLVGAGPFAASLADTSAVHMDFTSDSNTIRIVNDQDNNLRINPNNGTILGADTPVADPVNAEIIIGIAHAADRTLYGYNFSTDELVRIGGIADNPSASGGVVTPIGHFKLNGTNSSISTPKAGFDIAAAPGAPERGWLAAKPGNSPISLLTMNLATGDSVNLGTIGSGTREFPGLAVSPFAAAPGISTDGKSATWNDLDGDAVTLKVTKGTLTPAMFTMLGGEKGSALSRLALTGAQFAGTNITLTAKSGANGGDGSVNIGELNATGIDLGAVNVPGDLAVIRCGDATPATPGLKSLTVRSFGALGDLLIPYAASPNSEVAGKATAITIAGDFSTDLDTNQIGTMTIGGDVTGATGMEAGFISADAIGKLIIKGNLRAGNSSGQIQTKDLGSLVIGGSILGGGDSSSGKIFLNSAKPARITIGGSILGGTGSDSGTIESFGTGALTLIVKGSFIGDPNAGTGSATIESDGPLTLSIAGNLTDADVIGYSSIKSLTVGGSVEAVNDAVELSGPRIGSLVIKGSIIGTAANRVEISAVNPTNPATQAAALAIGKITVGGDVKHAIIGAGSDGFSSSRGDSAIGSIKIGGSLIASSISAGVDDVNNAFGDSDDVMQVMSNASGIIARIASIAIGGQIYGTAGGAPDSFGIQAEEIGSITVGKVKLALTAAKDNLLIGFTSDVRVREL